MLSIVTDSVIVTDQTERGGEIVTVSAMWAGSITDITRKGRQA